MASNRFRYPPAPGHGGDTFSDNLVGNQYTDGSSLMTLGTFSVSEEYSRTVATQTKIGGFSSPITLDSLSEADLTLNKNLNSNDLRVYVNNDVNDLSSFVLYGSAKKRLNVAVENVINNFPGAIYVDGIDIYQNSGNTTAYNIQYNQTTKETTFRVNVNYLSNPFNIEFTTNGNLLDGHLSPEQVLNNLEEFGNTANTMVKIAENKVSSLRNLTKEFKKYSLTFSGGVGQVEYDIVSLQPQTTTTNYIEITVKGKPFSILNTTTNKFYLKPNATETEIAFKNFEGVEAFLMNRDVAPIYTATFNLIKETINGSTYIQKVKKMWPLQDAINIDTTTPNYNIYINSLADLGDELDKQKTNLVSRFLTTPALKEFDTSDQKVEKTLQVYGRSFDDIKLFVDGIAYMTNVSYDGIKNIPNKLIKNFAQTLGWSTPNTLSNDKFMDSILGVSKPIYSGSSISKTPAELDIELYRRILMNTAYLFKSKGSRKSIEFLLSLLGAPKALVEFNEYVVIADAKLNMEKFDRNWEPIEGGSYTTGSIKYSVITGQFYVSTATTTHSFTRSDYPVSSIGYPQVPRESNNYFFQRGAGWFERTSEHKSELKVKTDFIEDSTGATTTPTSVLTGCNPTIITEFAPFTWGGFWTMGKFSNDFKAPYLDRFWRFPHMHYGFGLRRIIDDKKSWVKIGGGNLPELLFDDTPTYRTPHSIATAPVGFDPNIFQERVASEDCYQLRERKKLLLDKFLQLTAAGTHPLWRRMLISRVKYIEKIEKRRDCAPVDTRSFNYKDRTSHYQTTDERLVINVKNVDLNLNVGQALVYDIWEQSVNYDCLFSGGTLPYPYPSTGGRWDSTNPQINAKTIPFKSFLQHFWKFFIDTKNRMTINDGKTGGYPTLQKMYIDYLQNSCGENNKYTYNKMIGYAQSMGDYWIRIVEQMVPATTLWTSGVKVENSVFHRDKFVYRCFSLSGTATPSATTASINTALSGFSATPAPQYRNGVFSFAPPSNPTNGTTYYNNIRSGATANPLSTYANSYNINNQGKKFGSELISIETNKLANGYQTNQDKFTAPPTFTKQGSTDNLLCVYGFKDFGNEGLEWVLNYNLGTNNPQPTLTNTNTNTSSPQTSAVGGGGGGATTTTTGGGGGMSSGGGSVGGGGGGY